MRRERRSAWALPSLANLGLGAPTAADADDDDDEDDDQRQRKDNDLFVWLKAKYWPDRWKQTPAGQADAIVTLLRKNFEPTWYVTLTGYEAPKVLGDESRALARTRMPDQGLNAAHLKWIAGTTTWNVIKRGDNPGDSEAPKFVNVQQRVVMELMGHWEEVATAYGQKGLVLPLALDQYDKGQGMITTTYESPRFYFIDGESALQPDDRHPLTKMLRDNPNQQVPEFKLTQDCYADPEIIANSPARETTPMRDKIAERRAAYARLYRAESDRDLAVAEKSQVTEANLPEGINASSQILKYRADKQGGQDAKDAKKEWVADWLRRDATRLEGEKLEPVEAWDDDEVDNKGDTTAYANAPIGYRYNRESDACFRQIQRKPDRATDGPNKWFTNRNRFINGTPEPGICVVTLKWERFRKVFLNWHPKHQLRDRNKVGPASQESQDYQHMLDQIAAYRLQGSKVLLVVTDVLPYDQGGCSKATGQEEVSWKTGRYGKKVDTIYGELKHQLVKPLRYDGVYPVPVNNQDRIPGEIYAGRHLYEEHDDVMASMIMDEWAGMSTYHSLSRDKPSPYKNKFEGYRKGADTTATFAKEIVKVAGAVPGASQADEQAFIGSANPYWFCGLYWLHPDAAIKDLTPAQVATQQAQDLLKTNAATAAAEAVAALG